MPIDPNSFTQLNIGEQGSIMDETAVDYGDVAPVTNPYPLPPGSPVYRKRSRFVIAGQGAYEICSVTNSNIIGDEYGVTVKPIIRAYDNSINAFDDATGISPNSDTTIVSYTVPSSTVFSFLGCKVSGDLGAKFTVFVDASIVYTLRTTNANLDGMLYFNTPVFEVAAGSVILIKAIYYNNNAVTCDFEGTIIGFNTPV